MNVQDRSRTRLAETGLSVACLGVIVTFFAVPPVLFSSLSDSPVGLLFGVGVWLAPSLLGLLVLYRVATTERGLKSYILGGLSIITILTFLMNLRTVLSSPGFLTYGGRGAFFGPLLTLLLGCLIALGVLTSEWVTVRSNAGSKKAS